MMEDEPGENPAVEPGAVPPVLSYATPGRNRLVTVASYTQVFEADLARLKLESEGIDCFLSDENIQLRTVQFHRLHTHARRAVILPRIKRQHAFVDAVIHAFEAVE
jgi:hypothetical protein